MVSKTSKNKNEVGRQPRQSTKDDDLYLKLGSYICPFCKNPGRKRRFPHLCSLIHHIRREHVHRGTLET